MVTKDELTQTLDVVFVGGLSEAWMRDSNVRPGR